MNGTATAAMLDAAGSNSEAWAALVRRRVFFGHQSVGENLLAGVAELATAGSGAPLRIVEAAPPAEARPALYHARIGRNGDPSSKLADFVRRVRAARPDLAAMKFCYVDVSAHTDAEALFASYRRAMSELAEALPSLTIVHVTMPLTGDRGTLFHVRTVLRGKGARSDRRMNAIRQRYNELLRAEYAAREPLFDLAAIESTGADTRPRAVRYRGAAVPVLAHEWTYDGGHLNEAGRRRAAAAFLDVLASA